MTSPDGPEPITAPGIHDMPREQSNAALTQNQMKRFGTAFVNRLLATVLYALANVQVIGVNPFGFLRAWADELAQRADAAYSNAAVAQGSADTANTGLAILTARFNALGGGDNYWDTFDRDTPPSTPAVDALGPGYTLMYDSGSGYMETREADNGTTVWFDTGFGDRTLWVRRDDVLATTNNQRISVVINAFTGTSTSSKPHIRLMGRWNDGATMATSSFVQADITATSCEIGYVINGVYAALGAAVSVTTSAGDLWDFEVGTPADEWQFRLLQNNNVKVDRNDLGHLSMKDTTPGTLYQYSGFGADAGVHNQFGLLIQIGPPKVQVLAGTNIS